MVLRSHSGSSFPLKRGSITSTISGLGGWEKEASGGSFARTTGKQPSTKDKDEEEYGKSRS
jgi:hypothetical protein